MKSLILANPKIAKLGIVSSIIAILIITILEFPPPIGFETRSQANVSPLWLLLFLAILITEITTLVLLFKKPRLAAKFAIIAGALNIIQIFADQFHLMQPEIAPIGYNVLELSVGVISLVLIYFALNLRSRSQ